MFSATFLITLKRLLKFWLILVCSVLNVERGVEEIQADEAVDCQVMELLRDEVLPHSQHIPHQFILRVVMLLNKGSIHSATTAANIGIISKYLAIQSVSDHLYHPFKN